MKVLVVGASGFLGGTIARKFLQESAEVWGVYRSGGDRVPAGCRAVSFDELHALKIDFDVVVLAAGNYALAPPDMIDVNVVLPQRMAKLFPNAKLIFVSSVAVFGNHTDVMNEHSTFDNPSFYGLAKLAGEAVVQAAPKYAILRLTYLYGKNMAGNSFLPAIINKAKTKKQITLFGKGERLQDYLHARDAADLCFLAAVRDENGIYLGATGQSLSNLQVAELIAKHVPDCQISFAGDDTAPWFQFDPSHTMQTLHWQPHVDFETGLTEML